MKWEAIKQREHEIAEQIYEVERSFAIAKEKHDTAIQALRDEQRDLGRKRNQLAQSFHKRAEQEGGSNVAAKVKFDMADET